MQNSDATKTDLFFFNSINSKPPSGEFPSELEVTYTVEPSFKETPTRQDGASTLTMRLPIAVPPTQTPRLVSAGLALSPYHHATDYSSSEPRQRMLWLEFDQPLENGRDAYFARALAYSPDPMLTNEPPAPPPDPEDPPLPIDPELIQVITPGQSDDRAGLDAMQELIPSNSPRHFLVPLPPGLSSKSPELFGFFVYEVRVGHAEVRDGPSTGWSTARGRFGPPLRVTGVQHPAPMLTCQASRRRAGIAASAPFATPIFEGRRLLRPIPATEIWVLLYAQVTQVDGKEQRNILLGRKPAVFQQKTFSRRDIDLYGVAPWDQREIEALLDALALCRDSPLSLLAVEVLPEPVRFADPMGADLGEVRILRASPLTPVPSVCLD